MATTSFILPHFILAPVPHSFPPVAPLSHKVTMGLGILDPPGHPDSDPILRVPGTHVFWNTDVQTKDAHHIVLVPTVKFLLPAPAPINMRERLPDNTF